MEQEKESVSKALESRLGYKKKGFYETADAETVAAAYGYAPGYTAFLNAAKTEREAVAAAVRMAEREGYVPYDFGMDLRPGGKYLYNNRGRNLFLFRVGREPIGNGMRIIGAHVDSPRIDVKQSPLYEDGGFAFLKTRYYGGIRKYQWVTIPLSLHGVVVRKDGERVDVVIGEDEGDPVLYINDLLPHLAKEQSKKPLGTAFTGEDLNILLGSRPVEGCEKDGVRLRVLALLNERYGVTEEDFLSADLSLVPAGKARDVGLDRSLIGAYGHDDRVCAYPALTALLGSDDAPHTSLLILADKEETGSDGNTGMQCGLLADLMDAISRSLGGCPAAVRAASKCLSADVSSCFDPNFADVFDRRNVSLINHGIAMSKYTGGGGKSGTSEASAEYVAWIRRVFEEAGVLWQAGDLGKTDIGGGGTIAKFIARHNIEVVDLGVPVIAMHSPFEVVSKADLYTAHLAFRAFLRA